MNHKNRIKTTALLVIIALIGSCDNPTSEKPEDVLGVEDVSGISIETPKEFEYSTPQKFDFTPPPLLENQAWHLGGGYDSTYVYHHGNAIAPEELSATVNDTKSVMARGYTFVNHQNSVSDLAYTLLKSMPNAILSMKLDYDIKGRMDCNLQDGEVILASVVVVRMYEILMTNGKMTDDALSTTDSASFKNKYGNSYCSGAYLGGITVMKEGLKSSVYSKEDLKKALYLSYKKDNGTILTSEEELFMETVRSKSTVSGITYISTSPVLIIPNSVFGTSQFFDYYRNPTQPLGRIALELTPYSKLAAQ